MAKVYANLETSHFSAEDNTNGTVTVACGLDYGEPDATFYVFMRPKGGDWYEDLATGFEYQTVSCPDGDSTSIPVYAHFYGVQEVQVKHYDTNGYQGSVLMEINLEPSSEVNVGYTITQDDVDSAFEEATKDWAPWAAGLILGITSQIHRIKLVRVASGWFGIALTLGSKALEVWGPKSEIEGMEAGWNIYLKGTPRSDGLVDGASWVEDEYGVEIGGTRTEKTMDFFPTEYFVNNGDGYFFID